MLFKALFIILRKLRILRVDGQCRIEKFGIRTSAHSAVPGHDIFEVLTGSLQHLRLSAQRNQIRRTLRVRGLKEYLREELAVIGQCLIISHLL